MYSKKIYLLAGIFIISLTTMILFRTINWESRFYSLVNQKIVHTGWEMNVEDSVGSIFGTTFLKDVIFSHSSGSLIKIEKLSFNIGIISSIIHNTIIDFDLITMEGLDAKYISNQNSVNEEFYKKPISIPFNINTFFIDGTLTSNIDGNNTIFNILLGGELKTKQFSTVKFDLFKFAIDKNPQFNLHFDHLTMGDNGESYYLKNISGSFLNFPIKGDVYFEKLLNKIKGNVELMNFSIPQEMFIKLPLKTKFSKFNGKFRFLADFNSFNGEINLNNKLGLDMKGEFSIFKDSNRWILKNLRLLGEQSKLQMNGSWVDGQNFSSFMDLENFDLSR